MAVSDGQSVRLERRLRLVLRLVLYPVAIGLIALVWQHTHPQPLAHDLPNPPRPVHWRGQTSQHQPIHAVTALRRLQALRSVILMPCDDGSSVRFGIVIAAQDLIRRGDQFYGGQDGRISKDSAGRAMTVHAWVRASTTGNLMGRLTATAVTIDRRVECRTRAVSFTSTAVSS
jgi:hypothetical protein